MLFSACNKCPSLIPSGLSPKSLGAALKQPRELITPHSLFVRSFFLEVCSYLALADSCVVISFPPDFSCEDYPAPALACCVVILLRLFVSWFSSSGFFSCGWLFPAFSGVVSLFRSLIVWLSCFRCFWCGYPAPARFGVVVLHRLLLVWSCASGFFLVGGLAPALCSCGCLAPALCCIVILTRLFVVYSYHFPACFFLVVIPAPGVSCVVILLRLSI